MSTNETYSRFSFKTERVDQVAEITDQLEPFTSAVWWSEHPLGKELKEKIIEGIIPSENLALLKQTLIALDFSEEILEDILQLDPLEERNWLLENKAQFPSLSLGRFYIYGSHIEERAPLDLIPILLDESAAFGSGYHETTQGCILALNDLAQERSFDVSFDLGCGSAILAMVMQHLWQGKVIAADNDQPSVEIAKENCVQNHLPQIEVVLSDAFSSPQVQENAPYDLIAANILLTPLCSLAAVMRQNLKADGVLVLSGILQEQEEALQAAYLPLNLTLKKRYPINEWSTLVFQSI